MNTENFVIDDCGKSKVIEDVSAVSPHINGTILSEALVIEAINLCNLSAFMISSDQSDSLGISHLKG